MIRIISIIANESITGSSTLKCFNADAEFVYLEAFNLLHVTCDKSHTTLHVNDCMLAQRYSLHNASLVPISIRSVRLHVEHEISRHIAPIISRFQPMEATLLRDLFSPLFHDPSRIVEIEVRAERLFREWYNLNPSEGGQLLPALHGTIDPRLIKIYRFLRSHCEEVITLQQLADLINCNPVYLSNTYSKIFHVSPIKHLQRMKMDKARNLLHSTDMSVGEISQKLGYISSSQFSSLFKRYHGGTPLQIRRNSRLGYND